MTPKELGRTEFDKQVSIYFSANPNARISDAVEQLQSNRSAVCHSLRRLGLSLKTGRKPAKKGI
jgi:hypothetical protein